MLRFLPLLVLFISYSVLCDQIYAQPGIGIGTETPIGALEIVSTTGGLTLSRMTSAQRDLLVGNGDATTGSVIYQTNNSPGLYYYDGTSWLPLGQDNLGDHTATQNVQLGDNWLTNDGDNEGIRIATDGRVGIGTAPGTPYLSAVSNLNADGFLYQVENGTTGERDAFTIEDQDTGGGGQDHSSSLKVWRSGPINSGDQGTSLLELTYTGADPGDNKYWLSGRTTDEGAPLFGVDITDHDYWSSGGLTLGVTTNNNGSYSGGTMRINADGSTAIGGTTVTSGTMLDVLGKSRTTSLQVTSGATAGYVLTSDADGNATWQAASGGSSHWAIDGTYLYSDVAGASITGGGSYSVAAGNAHDVTASYAVALGRSQVVSGNYSLAGGQSHSMSGAHSISTGQSNTVVGNHSAIFGQNNVSSSDHTFIAGLNNTIESSDPYSAVVGLNNTVRSNYTFAAGRDHDVSGLGAVAFGNDNVINGGHTFAAGEQDSIVGSHNVAFGQQNIISATHSMAAGQSNTVSGSHAAAVGANNEAFGENTFVAGLQNVADGDFTAMVGAQNEGDGAYSFACGVQNDVFGDGAFVSGYLSRADGQVSVAMGFRADADDNGAFVFTDFTGNTLTSSTSHQFSAGFAGGYRFYTNANRTSGAFLNANATGWTTSSDLRLKTDVQTVESGLEAVLQLRPVSYYFKSDTDRVQRSHGFIAQEVATVLPDLVESPSEHNIYYSLRYTELIPILTKAIQEQAQQNEQMADKVTALEEQVARQSREMATLRAEMEALKALIQSK